MENPGFLFQLLPTKFGLVFLGGGEFAPFILRSFLNIYIVRDLSFATQFSLVAVAWGGFLWL